MENDETKLDNNVEEQNGDDNNGQPDNFDVGQGEAHGQENTAPEAPEATDEPESPVSSISERLGEKESGAKEAGVVNPEQTVPFDITKLSREQMQTLKQMLNATPDAQTRKRENPRVRLRRIDDKFVADFKRAYLTLVKDPENHRDVERHVIPVKFMGSDEYTPILYSKFINSEQVACEVVDSRQKVEEFIEGETFSRETGTMVEMVRKEVINWFTVKLPNGETAEIEGKIANA